MAEGRPKRGPRRVVIHLLPHTKRVSIARGLELILKSTLNTTIGVYAGADGQVTALVKRGPHVTVDALPKRFLEFCAARGVEPVDPSSPWQSNYTGKDRQNDLFEITVDQYREFAEGFGIEVEVGGAPAATVAANDEGVSETPPVAPSRPNEPPTWIGQAQARAREIIKVQRDRDLHPSQTAIADEIAREFRLASPQVVGVGGKPLTGAYIKRHALNGICSAQGRQQSTAIGRGKRGKK